MADERPQDAGRKRNRRAGQPSPETAALLERYQAGMRAELAGLLGELEPVPQDQGLGMVEIPDKRPELATRSKIWDLAIKLGRELGAAIDVAPPTDGAALPAPRRTRRPDYGGK